MKTLLTGGAGYIGSHTCVEVLKAGYDVVVIDNLVNSSKEAIRRVEEITGRKVPFYEGDVRDKALLEKIFAEEKIDAVIHFAGLKAVGESVQLPLQYYSNNIGGTLTLLEVMKEFDCRNFIFSSSATIYGAAEVIPIPESAPKGICTNPYGWTKSMLEQILMDLQKAEPSWNVVLLRYFNPIGAHESGRIGEDPRGIPNNLMPYITQVASGKLEKLHVFGDDYDTPDGTGVRDYIHVVDLARGHVKALEKAQEGCGLEIYNLGTGRGCSVLELARCFSDVTGIEIPYCIDPRRAGDIATCYCDPSKAERELGWKAEFDIRDMCRDSWRWQMKNPDGYGE